VLLEGGLHCLFGVAPGMTYVAHPDVSAVGCCFVAAGLVMLAGALDHGRQVCGNSDCAQLSSIVGRARWRFELLRCARR
jgi:hypothetical protein